MPLYKVEKNKNLFQTNSELHLIPEFSALDRDARLADRLMRFVILVADYDSPLKQHPEKKRRELAILAAGGKVQEVNHTSLDMRSRKIAEGKDEMVEAAIKKYREIQYNEDRNTLEAIQTQIDTIKTTIITPTSDVDELVKRNKLIASLPELLETKKRIARMSNIVEEVFESETSIEAKPMSLVDKIALENQAE
jgi:hypothetical protein